MSRNSMDPKMARALRINGGLNLLGLGASFVASAWMVRSLDSRSYAELGVVSALVGVVGFFAEAGGNAGFSRFFHKAQAGGFARGFYSGMLRQRIWSGLLAALVIAALGPLYVQHTGLSQLRDNPSLFFGVGILCGTMLGKWLPHYGLMAMLEPGSALGMQHGFMVLRSGLSALGGAAGAGVAGILAIWIGTGFGEAWCFHKKLSGSLQDDLMTPPCAFFREANRYGLNSSLDKACAMLGGGSALLLFFAARYGVGDAATDLAFVALGYEVTGKILGLTVMPMANLVTPYLSRISETPGETARAGGAVCSLSALLYAGSIGTAFVAVPMVVPFFYGGRMDPAAAMIRLILVPMAVEAWARGVVSPVLLRNGKARVLFWINAVQFLVTLGSVWISWSWSMPDAILGIGSARGLAAVAGFFCARRHFELGTLRRVGLVGGVTGCAVILAEFFPRWLGLPKAWESPVFFVGLFLLGIGLFLRWDQKLRSLVLRAVHGLMGGVSFGGVDGMVRGKFFTEKGGKRQ